MLINDFIDIMIKTQASPPGQRRFSKISNGISDWKRGQSLPNSRDKTRKSTACNSPKCGGIVLLSSPKIANSLNDTIGLLSNIASATKNKDNYISQLNSYYNQDFNKDTADLSPISQKGGAKKMEKNHEELQAEIEKWKKFGKLMADSYDELNKKFNVFLKDQEKDKKIIQALKDQVYNFLD